MVEFYFRFFGNVGSFDKKLAKIAAIFIVLGVLFFIWGIMSE